MVGSGFENPDPDMQHCLPEFYFALLVFKLVFSSGIMRNSTKEKLYHCSNMMHLLSACQDSFRLKRGPTRVFFPTKMWQTWRIEQALVHCTDSSKPVPTIFRTGASTSRIDKISVALILQLRPFYMWAVFHKILHLSFWPSTLLVLQDTFIEIFIWFTKFLILKTISHVMNQW